MDKDDISEYRRGWLEHPHTRRLRKSAESQLASSFELLKIACLNSSDAKVRGCYVDWLARGLMLRSFEDGESR